MKILKDWGKGDEELVERQSDQGEDVFLAEEAESNPELSRRIEEMRVNEIVDSLDKLVTE